MRHEWWSRCVLWGLVLVGWGSFVSGGMASEVAVEISDKGQPQIKIAIPPLINQHGIAEALEGTMADLLRNDLRLSGFFDTLTEKSGLIEGIHHADLKNNAIQFKQWAEMEARLMIKGNYTAAGETLKLEFRMYDTLGGDLIMGKRYESSLTQVRDVIHRFADEVILKITGRRGMSSAKLVFISDRSGSKELYQIDFDGGNLIQLTHDHALMLSPSVSPDGKKVVYTSYKDNNPDLFVLSLETQQVEPVAIYPGLNFAAAWAPDNRTLAVTLSKDGNPELYVLDSVSREAARLTRNHWNDVSASWSPDGTEIVYTADDLGAPQLYVLKRSNNSIRRLTFRGAYNVAPAWSPTDNLIAFTSSMDGNFNIYTIQTDGDNLLQLTQQAGNNEEPVWSADGRYIAFHSTRGGKSSIYVMNADGTNQRRLTDGKGNDVSPDWIR